MKDKNFLITNGVAVDSGISLLGDINMYNQIMGEFQKSFNDRMANIKTYREMSDMANYAIEVHSLKSDSKYLGFTTLAELAYNHEMASKAGDITSVNNHYNELITEANRIISVVNSYLGSGVDSSNNPPVVNINTSNSNDVVEVISPKEVNMATKAILVADDSSIIRDFVKEIFSDSYDVLMASNGQEVINIVSSNQDKIAAVLLDLNMPVISGFEVLEYFKENNLFNKIPISIISGASDKESIDKAFTYPVVDMLNKPFSKENVKLVVEKTIDYGNI